MKGYELYLLPCGLLWYDALQLTSNQGDLVLPLERKQRIIEYLSHRAGATVVELSVLCGVSQMTIRRDLESLAEEQIIERTHGGAVYVGSVAAEPPFSAKKSEHEDLKERIAAYAAQHFITDGQVIILEGGTTVASLVPHMARYSELTVVTNGLRTVSTLHSLRSTHTVICTGGILRNVSSTFVGPMTEHFFRQLHAHVAFFSATGFTLEGHFTDPNLLESQVKVEMRAAASKVVMLLDSTKFGQRSFTKTFRIDEVDVLVTDDRVPRSAVEELMERGVDVHIAR